MRFSFRSLSESFPFTHLTTTQTAPWREAVSLELNLGGYNVILFMEMEVSLYTVAIQVSCLPFLVLWKPRGFHLLRWASSWEGMTLFSPLNPWRTQDSLEVCISSISVGMVESSPSPLEEIILLPASIISPDSKALVWETLPTAHCLAEPLRPGLVTGSATWGPLVNKWLRGENHAH